MTSAGEITVDAVLNTVGYRSGAERVIRANNEIRGSVEKTGGSTEESSRRSGSAAQGFSAKMAAVAGVVGGLASNVIGRAFDMIGSSVTSAVNRADMMNNFPKVMKNLGFSADDAARSVRKISSSLDGLPTTSSAMTGMVQQLAPLTKTLDEATDISLAFNNAMLAGGASTMEQENALEQYTQMLSAGKVDMQAWRSIQAAMPGQLNQLAEALLGAGKNGNDLYDAMKSGKVSFDDFNHAVVRLNKDGFGKYASFAQQAKDATQGIGTAVENAKNRVSKAVQKIIEAFGVDKISGAINGFTSQFGKVGEAFAQVVKLLETGQFTQAFADAFHVDKNNPLVTFLLDLRGLVSDAFQGVKAALDDFKNYWKSVWDGLKSNGAMDSLNSLFNDVTQGVKDLAKAFKNVKIDFSGLVPPKLVADGLKKLIDLLDWIVKHGKLVAASVSIIGAALAGIKISEGVSRGVDAFKQLSGAISAVKAAVSGGGDLFSGLSAALSGIGESGSGIGGVVAKIRELSEAAKVAGGGITGLSTALGLGPWGLVAAAIAAVVAALIWFFTQTEVGRQAWQAFTDFLASVWNGIKNVATSVWNGLAQFFTNLWNTISSGALAGWNAITQPIIAAWNGLVAAFRPLADAFKNIFSTMWLAIRVVFGVAITGVIAVAHGLWNGLSAVFNAIKNAVVTVWNGIKSATMAVWNAIWPVIQGPVNAIRNGINAMLSFIRGVWSAAWNGIKNVATSVWNGLTSSISAGVQRIRGVFNGVKDVITGAFHGAGSWLSNIGRNIINGLARGINNALGWLKTQLSKIANIIPGWLKDRLGIHSPSRVMADQVGRFIPAGIGVGIAQALPRLESTLDQTVTGMISVVASHPHIPALAGAATAPRYVTRNITQNFPATIIRADSDLYTAYPQIYRSAVNELSKV